MTTPLTTAADHSFSPGAITIIAIIVGIVLLVKLAKAGNSPRAATAAALAPSASGTEVSQQVLVEMRVANDGKRPGTAFLFWLFLGVLSGHRFYLGRPGSALLQIVLNFAVVGLIWTFLDVFFLGSMARSHNDRLRRQYAAQ